MLKSGWIAFILMLLLSIAFAEERKTYQINRATSEIVIDGSLDEEAWKRVTPIELPFETNPADNVPAPVKTECKITYDDHSLYAGCIAYDPNPAQIRAHVTDRDNAFDDDFMGIVIDASNDGRRAFEFFVNPLGVQMDLVNDDVSMNEDSTWDAIWKSAGRITETGYQVEMEIPFSALRFRKSDQDQTWGVDILRIYPRNVRHRLGVHKIDKNISCYLCQESKLRGFAGVHPGSDLELDPTYTANKTASRPDGSSPLQSKNVHSDVGVSARWGITPNLSFNGAVNPDFSQVEADVAQLSINTRFALFYPEKRPFFLEGADLFTTLLNIIYTRTIADPNLGLKLTSKSGSNAFGVLFAQDEVTNLILPANQTSEFTSLDQNTSTSILRYRRDIGASSTIGALFTDREGSGYFNRVIGADGQLRWHDVENIRFQFLGSQTSYPDSIVRDFNQPADTLNSAAISLRYRHQSKSWFWRALYEDFGKDFRADAGFIPRVDTRQVDGILERDWWPVDNKYCTLFFLGTENSRITDHTGLLTDQFYSGYIGYNGPLQSRIFVQAYRAKEYFQGVTYDETYATLDSGVKPTGFMQIAVTGKFGDAVDYDNGRPASIFKIDPIVTTSLGRHLQTQLDWTYLSLDVPQGHLFTANLAQVKFIYQFNVRMFVRAIFQYSQVTRDVPLYIDPVNAKDRGLFTQLLFSYKLNPQSVFFLGYSDNRADEDGYNLIQTDRTVFLKIGYAFLF